MNNGSGPLNDTIRFARGVEDEACNERKRGVFMNRYKKAPIKISALKFFLAKS